MELSFLQVLVAVASLVILTIPAFLLVKFKVVNLSAAGVLSSFVLYVCSPAQIFMSFQKINFSHELAMNILTVAMLALAMYIILTLVSFVIVRGKDDRARLIRFNGIISNCGYMGIPFLQMLFPTSPEVIIYAAIIIAVQNVYMWTAGVLVLTGSNREMSIKKTLLNPCVVSVILGTILFVLVKKPLVSFATAGSFGGDCLISLMKGVDFFGNMVTPLAMSVIGIRIANVKIKELFLDKQAYFSSFFRLVLSGLIAMLLVAFLPVDTMVKYNVFFAFCMPGATAVVMFAIRFKSDGNFASVIVLLSTALSVLTIPLMFLLFKVVV